MLHPPSEFAMPKYDYTCTACDVYWELERPMADANASTLCPLCGEHSNRVYTMLKLLFRPSRATSAPPGRTPVGRNLRVHRTMRPRSDIVTSASATLPKWPYMKSIVLLTLRRER